MTDPRIRVMVCDDSVVIRRLVADILSSDPEIEVVGTAVNGKNALDKLPVLRPDLLTLDVEMPVMDGLETLVELRKTDKKLPVIMFSTLTERGAGATLDALERGASDYVTKPANVGSVSESMEAVRSQLIPKIKSLTRRMPTAVRPARPAFSSTAGQAPYLGHHERGTRPGQVIRCGRPAMAPGSTPPTGPAGIIAIGVSTGGPDALTTLIGSLPASFPVPIVVTQHMPPVFTQLFAQRLNGKTALEVTEARHGDPVVAGRVLIAPGDYHMRVVNKARLPVVHLDQEPQENYCRPAVDPMFRSVADQYGARTLAVIMTGMGSDGVKGAEHVINAGGSLLVQDEETSVVWGMPGAAVAAGLPCTVLPLDKLADTFVKCTAGAHPAGAYPAGASTRRTTL